MSNITFVLFAYNEEKRISYAIKNFIKYGQVIILDGGSTDKTQEISEALGATFLLRPERTNPSVETQENFEFIKNNCTTEWIYWGYVDNIAPKTLLEKMVAVSTQEKIKLVNIPLYTYLWGYTEEFAHKSYAPFLFHKDFVDFKNNYIHGLGKFTGNDDQSMFLENTEDYALRHFSTYNGTKFVTGHLRYANAEASEKFRRKEKFSTIKMIFAMVRYCFIYGRYSYKNGNLGLIVILHYAFFRLMTYTKLYELEHSIDLDTIEENYSKVKESILKDVESTTSKNEY